MSAALIPGAEDLTGADHPAPPPSRRRAWRTLIIVVLVAAIYVAAWFSYTARLSAGIDRYRALPVGAALVDDDADYRVISVVQTPYLIDESKGPVASTAGTVWVRAVIEATLRQATPDFYCTSPDLVGAQGRRFEADSLSVYRPNEPRACSPENARVGVPYRYEVLYSVPYGQLGGIMGLTLPTYYAGQVKQVARPG